MAKVTLDPVQQHMWMLYGYIGRTMDEMGFDQADMAAALGMSQQTFSYRKSHYAFTIPDLFRIFKEFGTSDADILRIVRC